MNIRLHVELAVDALPFAPSRADVVAAMVAMGEQAFEAGRIDGRLQVLLGEADEPAVSC